MARGKTSAKHFVGSLQEGTAELVPTRSGAVPQSAANAGASASEARKELPPRVHDRNSTKYAIVVAGVLLALVLHPWPAGAQATAPRAKTAKPPQRPKLVVLIVVDQMRADYVDKFSFQWTGGLKRLLAEGAWFRNAAFPYAITTTCAGHATISTGALPATHGMISNEWWDRELHKEVACTEDSMVKNIGYAGATVSGGNSAARLLLPAFADELKFQSGPGVRVVSFSLKARSAITLGGRTGDAVTWFDPSVGAWVTSSAYPVAKFVEEYAKAHPVSGDYGKTWAPLLPRSSAYLYPETAIGAVTPPGFGPALPHPLRGMPNSTGPDPVFYDQWEGSPYADTYLSRLAEAAVDKLELGKRTGTDFLAVGFSPVDHAGHAFGPRSWEIQDILARLDRDLAELFSHLDRAVGKGNYVVAFSSDHGVGPTPEDLLNLGIDSGLLNIYKVQEQIDKALEPFHFPKQTVSKITRTGVYFTPGTYDKLKAEPEAWHAVLRAMLNLPGVAGVYRAEELENRPSTLSPMGIVQSNSFFLSRSGDLTIVLKPYWILDYTKPGKPRDYGATHGGPYAYDQRVPVVFMGYGIQPGEYFQAITPADIAPTLAALCGITLVAPDGHVLAEALKKRMSLLPLRASQ